MAGPVLPPDLDAKLQEAVRTAEEALRQLDHARQEAKAAAREIRRAVEEHVADAVASWAPERSAEAKALAARTVRIADEVAAWAVGRSPIGLAQRLIPELRDGVEELRAFLGGPPKLPRSTSPPPPARPAP